MRFLAALMLVVTLAGNAFAEPSFPALSGRVVDNAKIISPNVEEQLTQMLQAHERATTNQVVVVTLPDLQNYTLQEYGYQLGRHWGIGQKDQNNGVLIIVAPNQREARIEVGYGLEGKLTDALSSQILTHLMLPEFKQGRYEAGILKGTKAVVTVLEGHNSLQPTGKKAERVAEDEGLPLEVILLIIVVFIIRYVIFRKTGIWIGGFGGRSGSGGGFFRGGGGRFGGGGSGGKW